MHAQFPRVVIQLGNLLTLARKGAKPKGCHAACRPAICLEQLIVQRFDADVEGLSDLAQRSEAVFDEVARICFEPA